jgi:hypothetical protein
VLYLEQHFTGDIGEFQRNNFLTTMAAKLTSPKPFKSRITTFCSPRPPDDHPLQPLERLQSRCTVHPVHAALRTSRRKAS